MVKDWASKIKAYALKNAVEHEGKAQEGSVISGLFAEGLKREEVKSVIQEVKKVVSEVNKLSPEIQQEEYSNLQDSVSHRSEREGLPELPNVKGKVKMRFAPSPSGPMHIGHAATGMPTSLYVKKYGGKFYFRIEDTNPENIDPKAYDMLVDEANWLFGNVSEVIIQSDRMEIYYKYALNFIKKGLAYVCTCPSEKFKELVEKKEACPCRNLSAKENTQRWSKMLENKGYKEGEAVLRFKSDLEVNNPALRDFPLARINLSPHPRKKNKYRVWPLMNLAVTADDIEYGMTHIIRAKDHMDNAKRQEIMYNAIGLSKKIPATSFLGRYNFTDLEISASKTRKLIEEKKYTGWDDVRLPFIAALRKRGYQPGAFVFMAEQRGLSDVDKVLSQGDYFQLLNEFNRKLLHEIAEKIEVINNSKGKFTLVKEDASEIKFDAKIIPKVDSLYHLLGLGYARYDKDKKFYFAHP